MNRLLLRFHNLPVRHQLIAGIALIHALLMTLMVIDLTAGQRDFLRHHSEENASRIAETLAVGSVSWVMANDVAGLQEVIQSVGRDQEVRYAMLLSPEGRVLAHSNSTNVGAYLQDAISLGLLANLPALKILVASDDLVDVAAPVMAGKRFLGWARVGIGQERIAANLRQVRLKGAIFILFAIATGSFFAVLMANGLTRGVSRLVSAIEKVRGGQRGFRLDFQRKDEIGRLGDDFNLMLAALEKNEAEIRELNMSLEQRVHDRTSELESANKELESFSYSVSHDLRAPLRAVSGFAQILARRHRASLDEEGRHYLDNVVSASERMGTLIEDLLHYSRTGRGAVRAVPVPLKPIVEQLASTFGERIAAAGALFEVLEPLATPLGDATLVGQILSNLVDNALTYCRRDGTPQVTLSSVREGARVILRVADNGIGIAAEYHEKIFQVFQRLHSEDEYPGTGIGLAVVAKAVRLMEGEVSIESSPGQGSSFIVRLPAASEQGGQHE